jgi:hypothetical protein
MSATVFFDDANELATLTNVFSVNGTPTDPSAVTLTITDPTGATTTPAPTHSSTGTYTADVACTVVGIWAYLWEGTGSASDAIAGTWTVITTAAGQRYATVEELKSRLAITGTSDDLELQLATEAAARAVDGYCDRYFYRGSDTRTYVPEGLYRCCTDDLVSVTTLATDPAGTGSFTVTWSASDYQLLPYNPGSIGEQWPYTSIRAVGSQTFPWIPPESLLRMNRVQVVGVFGWPAVPLAVKQAALIAATDLFKLKDAPYGVAGFGEFGAVRIQDNLRVASLLAPYRRSPVLIA